MKKTILIGTITVSVLILLASLPSVFASQTYQLSEITPEIRDQFVNKLKDIKSGSPLDWSPGLVIKIFSTVINLYIDYIINNGWSPGLTLAVIYLFFVLVLFGLLLNNPE